MKGAGLISQPPATRLRGVEDLPRRDDGTRQTEVAESEVTFVVDEDVLRFDVTKIRENSIVSFCSNSDERGDQAYR